jgi:FkbM family methyltransferase
MRDYSEQVISYEPVPELARLLKYKFNIVSPSNVRVRHSAVSNQNGHTRLVIPKNAEWLSTIDTGNVEKISQHFEHIAVVVDVVALEELGGATIGMIKIDVEGHEVEVIAGAMPIIKRDRPNILVESEERHRSGSLQMIRELLEPIGYQGYYISDDGLTEIEKFSLGSMQDPANLKEDGTDRIAGKTYINNFIFLTEQATRAAISEALR